MITQSHGELSHDQANDEEKKEPLSPVEDLRAKGEFRHRLSSPLGLRSRRNSVSPPKEKAPVLRKHKSTGSLSPTRRLSRVMSPLSDIYSKSRDSRRQSKEKKKILKAIPEDCINQWKAQYWSELNRFAKLGSTPYITSVNGERIAWSKRIYQDLQRATRLTVSGDVSESFEFPLFNDVEQRECLVDTCVKFLNAAIEDLIFEKSRSLDPEVRRALAVKAVNQALISLCQDFINEPYFKILKTACEKFSLTPTSWKPKQPEEEGNWLAGIKISINKPLLSCQCCRMFKTMRIDNFEVESADYVFGFQRSYVIDMMGGPPKILPPVWLARNKEQTLEFYTGGFPNSNIVGYGDDEKEKYTN